MMKTSASWSPASNLKVVGVQRGEKAWTVTVDSRQPTCCPGCGTQSKSRHSVDSRRLRDLSSQGAPVIVNARVARWRCRNERCDRRTDYANLRKFVTAAREFAAYIASNTGKPHQLRRTISIRRAYLLRISALCWRGFGPKALPKSGICSPKYAIAATQGPSVIWRVSSLPGAAAGLCPTQPSKRRSHRFSCEQ